MTDDARGPQPSEVAGEVLERAALALLAGEVVGIPTDTVYGLAVDPRRREATNALFELKGRPRSFQLPVLVADVEQADRLADGGLSAEARAVAARFWPGAVTLVLKRRASVDWDLGDDASTIGLRCPSHPVPRWLCERVGPIAATSANFHGRPPLTDAAEMDATFAGRIALVVDGGPAEGLPSTVVDLSDGLVRCVREGAVPMAEIKAVLR